MVHALQTEPAAAVLAAATRSASSYTYSKFTEAIEFLNAADPEPWKGISSVRTSPHRLTVNGILGAAVRPRAAGSARDAQRRRRRRSSAAGRCQGSTPTRAASRSASATSSSPATSTTSRCRRASGRWRAGSTPTPASTRCRRSSSASNVRTFPLRLENVRADTVNNVDLSLIKNTSVRGQDASSCRFDALNAFNHPLLPAGGTDTDAPVGHHGVDAAELRAAHPGRRRRSV